MNARHDDAYLFSLAIPAVRNAQLSDGRRRAITLSFTLEARADTYHWAMAESFPNLGGIRVVQGSALKVIVKREEKRHRDKTKAKSMKRYPSVEEMRQYSKMRMRRYRESHSTKARVPITGVQVQVPSLDKNTISVKRASQ